MNPAANPTVQFIDAQIEHLSRLRQAPKIAAEGDLVDGIDGVVNVLLEARLAEVRAYTHLAVAVERMDALTALVHEKMAARGS